MAGIKEAALQMGGTLIKTSIRVLGTEWKEDDLRGLLNYDVLKFAALLYVLSDTAQRQQIIKNAKEILQLTECQEVIEELIGEMDPKALTDDMYHSIPFLVGIYYEFDLEYGLKSLSYAFLEVEQAMILGMITEDDQLTVNDKSLFFKAYIDIWTNRLVASGISTDVSLQCNLPAYDKMKELYNGRISDYADIPGCRNGKRVYSELKRILQQDTLTGLVFKSRGVPVRGTYTRLKYTEQARAIENIIHSIHEAGKDRSIDENGISLQSYAESHKNVYGDTDHQEKLENLFQNYPLAWKRPSIFCALLMDYFPLDKPFRNLMLVSAEENIFDELSKKTSLSRIESLAFRKRLAGASGISEEEADTLIGIMAAALHLAEEGIPAVDFTSVYSETGDVWDPEETSDVEEPEADTAAAAEEKSDGQQDTDRQITETGIVLGHPVTESEYDHLIKEIHTVQQRIIDLTAKRDDLLYRICPALRAEYEAKIGSLERELLAAQLHLRELQRILELLQAQINRQEAPDLSSAEEKAQDEFKKYQDDLNQKAKEAEEFSDYWKNQTHWSEFSSSDKDTDGTDGRGEDQVGPDDGNKTERCTDSKDSAERVKNPAAELKKLYKKIVKRLHPDVHPNPSEREKELLNRAIHAYKAGDLGEMRRIWDELIGMEPPEEQFDDTADGIRRLKEMLEKLKKIIVDLETEIQKIRSEFPYTMKQMLDDEDAVKQKQEFLNAQITAAREMLQALTAAIQEIKEKLA